MKKDFIRRMRAALEVTEPEAEEVVEFVIDIMREALERGEEVNIYEFGKFTRRHWSKRIGRDPRTGQRFELEARASVIFYPSKPLRQALRRATFAEGKTMKSLKKIKSDEGS